MGKFINPFSDWGFKLIFGQEKCCLSEIADITALSKEDRDKYDESIKIMRDNIAAYKGAVLEGKIEIAKNMLLDNEPIDKISRYTGLSKDEISKLN